MTPHRPPFISREDRDRARKAAKPQRSWPAVSHVALAVSLYALLTTNTSQRAEQLRLLQAEIRDAIPDAIQAQFAQRGPIDFNPYGDIERRLESPLSGFLVWQQDVEAMRSDVAARHAIDKTLVQSEHDEKRLITDIKAAEVREARQRRITVRVPSAG